MKLRSRKKIVWAIVLGILSVFVFLQIIDKPIENKPLTNQTQIPQEVNAIFERACYNCHSNETNFSWYDKVAPVSWLVKKDVDHARSVMNFSNWNNLPPEQLKGNLWAVFNMIKSGEMPLHHYIAIHPEAKITDSEIAAIGGYVNSLSTEYVVMDTLRKEAADKEFELWKVIQHSNNNEKRKRLHVPADTVQLSPNGVEYTADYKNWKVLSLNTLYDNSMRVTYGNDIAVKAVEEENINPFPDGAIVVKAVWEQVQNNFGEIRPGKFVNVQFMVKDANKYPDTEGWGFAKFSTSKLTPYGDTPSFGVTSCISCHRLRAKENGYLFNIPLKIDPKDIKL